MGEIVKYKISKMGDLKIEEEYDYEFQHLHLYSIAGSYFDGGLSLYLDGTTLNFPNTSVLDALLGIYDGMLQCLNNPSEEIEEKILIMDYHPYLKMSLTEYKLNLIFDYLNGSCDINQLFSEVLTAIKEIMELMYSQRQELAAFEIDHGPELDKIRLEWITKNKISIDETMREKILKNVGKMF